MGVGCRRRLIELAGQAQALVRSQRSTLSATSTSSTMTTMYTIWDDDTPPVSS